MRKRGAASKLVRTVTSIFVRRRTAIGSRSAPPLELRGRRWQPRCPRKVSRRPVALRPHLSVSLPLLKWPDTRHSRRMASPLTTPARVLYAAQICQRTKCEESDANPRLACDLAHTSRLCRQPPTATPALVSVQRRLTASEARQPYGELLLRMRLPKHRPTATGAAADAAGGRGPAASVSRVCS